MPALVHTEEALRQLAKQAPALRLERFRIERRWEEQKRAVRNLEAAWTESQIPHISTDFEELQTPVTGVETSIYPLHLIFCPITITRVSYELVFLFEAFRLPWRPRIC